MSKVLIITYYWPPAGGAGVQRWLKFCKHLPEYGVDPIILTVEPEFATYPQMDNSLDENVDGSTEVIRTKSFEPLKLYAKIAGKKRVPYGGFSNAKSNSKFSKFIRGNFFIPDARRGWNTFARTKALEILEGGDIHTVITTGPPHSTHLIGLWLKQRKNIQWVADLRDPWTDIYYNKEMHRTPWAKNKDLQLEKKVLETADTCITVSNGFKALFESKVSRPYHVLTNGYDADDLKLEKNSFSKSDKFVIVYVGTIAESYQPSSFFKVLSELTLDYEFRIAGNVPGQLLQKMEYGNKKANVNLLGYVPHSEIHKELVHADVLLLFIPQVENSSGIIPGKLFEYLATGKPILAITEDVNGDVSRILKETGRGKCFKRNDLDGMTKYLEDISKNDIVFGGAEANKSIEKYSRRKLTEELLKILNLR